MSNNRVARSNPGAEVKGLTFGVNQMFWGKDVPTTFKMGEDELPIAKLIEDNLPELTKEFAKESIYEVICRRLLTDENIQLDAPNGGRVGFPQFIATIRQKPLEARKTLYNHLTQKTGLNKLASCIPSFVSGPAVCSAGWEFITTEKLSNAQVLSLIKDAMRMLCLIDDLSLAVIDAMGGVETGNSIDLPWNAKKIIKALNNTKYPITSMGNWMYAQGIPYVDNSMFAADGVLVSMTARQEMFVVNQEATGYMSIPFSQFRPAYEQGYLMMELDAETTKSLGWEEVHFNG